MWEFSLHCYNVMQVRLHQANVMNVSNTQLEKGGISGRSPFSAHNEALSYLILRFSLRRKETTAMRQQQ